MVFDGEAVAGGEGFAKGGDVSGDDLDPGVGHRFGGRGGDGFAGFQFAEMDFDVLADGCGVVVSVTGEEQGEVIFRGGCAEWFFGVAGRTSFFGGLDPDLVEVGVVLGGGVELAVSHAGAGTHVLEVSGFDDGAVAHAVLMLELALDDVGEDFHVGMGVLGEAAAGSDGVVVDDAEVAEAHVVGIEVVGKGKGEAGLEPAVVGLAAISGGAFGDGGLGLCGHG